MKIINLALVALLVSNVESIKIKQKDDSDDLISEIEGSEYQTRMAN